MLPILLLVKSIVCELSDDDLADLLLREGSKISENQDLFFLQPSSQGGRRTRTKRAYWGFDKLYADAVETKNDFSRLGQMIGGFIKENTQDGYYDYEYGASSYQVGSQDGYGHKKKHKKTKKKKVIEICSSSNSWI